MELEQLKALYRMEYGLRPDMTDLERQLWVIRMRIASDHRIAEKPMEKKPDYETLTIMEHITAGDIYATYEKNGVDGLVTLLEALATRTRITARRQIEKHLGIEIPIEKPKEDNVWLKHAAAIYYSQGREMSDNETVDILDKEQVEYSVDQIVAEIVAQPGVRILLDKTKHKLVFKNETEDSVEIEVVDKS